MTAAPVLVLRAAVPATPHRLLMPNARPDWHEKARAAKALREAAHLAAVDALNVGAFAPLPDDGPLWLDVTIFWETGRRTLDWDNAIASAKALYDGIFDALEANDRRVGGIRIDQVRTDDPHGVTTVSVYAGPAPWGGGAATEGNEA